MGAPIRTEQQWKPFSASEHSHPNPVTSHL